MSPDGTVSSLPDTTLDQLKSIVGENGFIDNATDATAYLTDWRGQYRGTCALVLRPNTTEQVSNIVKICAEHKITVVPQGGNTGMNGGATPAVDSNAVLLCLGRMNKIRKLDTLNYTATVEAGCILQTIQDIADEEGRLFPLSLGAEGSCQIGGNLATNAGGVSVLRYGNMRDLVLGLEVVLPSGEIWNGLRSLRKDNTGYDLKHLFIGSEGTLGIITAATLKLFPKPKSYQTCFAAINGLDEVVELLARARQVSGDRVSSFEMITRPPLDFALKHGPNLTEPLSEPSDIYGLIEIASSDPTDESLEQFLERGFEDGLITDAIIAQSEGQRSALWKLREYLPEGEKEEGASIKHDISVPVSSIPAFVRKAIPAVTDYMAKIRPVYFGHVGDGNLHFNFAKPTDMADDEFFTHKDAINHIVLDLVAEFEGSISAEHGIGQLKRDSFLHYTPNLDINLMRQLKAALDPHGIMNPGKLL
ncbi:MAG: hydroxyacid dehydrogenase [Rhodospirillaceae bacterium]|nr:hydroxyacid dehydrogenase [Rhodospirillaceae bacterium]